MEFPVIDDNWALGWTEHTDEGDAATAVDSDHLFLSLGNSYFDEFFPPEYTSKLGESDASPLNAHACPDNLDSVNASHHGSIPKRKSGDRSGSSGRSTSGEEQRPRKKKARSARFSEAQTAALQSWLDSNTSNPYPTEQDKRELSEKTGLTTRQVEAWFSSTRRRKLESCLKKAQLNAFYSQELAHLSPSSPLERSLSESPDAEAVEAGVMVNLISLSMMKAIDQPSSTQVDSTYVPFPPSKAIGGYASSAHSFSSAGSASSFASFGPRKGRRRHYTAQPPKLPTKSDKHRDKSNRAPGFGGEDSTKENDNFPMSAQASGHNVSQALLSPFSSRRSEPDKPYQCTFCFKGFRKTYEWRRHMESTHFPTTEWVCFPPGRMYECIINPCGFVGAHIWIFRNLMRIIELRPASRSVRPIVLSSGKTI